MKKYINFLKRRAEHFPIAFFSICMGLGVFSIGFDRISRIFEFSAIPSIAMTFLTAGFFGVFLVAFLGKMFLYPKEVTTEWNHPVKMAFFPTISISALILSICFFPISQNGALALFWIGTALHFFFSLSVISRWFLHTHFRVEHLTPAWFIPAVGNVIVPVAGMPLSVSPLFLWFFFSLGMLFWGLLFSAFFFRAVFFPEMPARLLPTTAILIAPPAIGFLALSEFGSGGSGLAVFFFFVALFLFLIVLLHSARFAKIPFFLSWWAYSFPLAALTLASFRLSHEISEDFFQ